MTYEQMPDEWQEWLELTPIERFRESEKIFAHYLAMRGGLIPTPIRQVLFTIQANGVQASLMGGQARVFYGAAQVSKGVDLFLLASAGNYQRLEQSLHALNARRLAVPPFDPAVLARGHAVHFRCAAAGVEDLRIDIMTRLRDLPDFAAHWDRRTTIADQAGAEFHLLSIPDLVAAKKTQRTKDWLIIELLVAIHYHQFVE